MLARLFLWFRPRGGPSLRLRAAATPLFAMGGGSEQNAKYMIGIVILCIVVGLVLGVLSLRARRARRIAGQARQNVILETLRRVMHRQGRLDMYPAQRRGNANAPVLSGRCAACGETGLRLDFTLTKAQPDWPHQVVDVYFHESLGSEVSFSVFTNTIQQVRRDGTRLIVDMTLPLHLRQEQKRALFRVTLPPKQVPALAIWRMSAEQSELDRTSGRTLGRPLCAYRPQRKNELALADISAGGARLTFDAAHCRELGGLPEAGDWLLLLTVFGDKQGVAESRQFWFKCLCRHIGTQPDNAPYAGLQFRAWSVTQKLTDPIVWHDVEENGEVPPLFEWLMKYSREAHSVLNDQVETNHISL